MIHNIKINGEIKSADCKIGSGIYDKNGREIFEGDKVKYIFSDYVQIDGKFKNVREELICTVEFEGGHFGIVSPREGWIKDLSDCHSECELVGADL